jgi:hypothetical protein
VTCKKLHIPKTATNRRNSTRPACDSGAPRGRYPDYRKAFEESGYGNLWFDAPIYVVMLQNPSYQVTDLGSWIHGANKGALALENWIKKK